VHANLQQQAKGRGRKMMPDEDAHEIGNFCKSAIRIIKQDTPKAYMPIA